MDEWREGWMDEWIRRWNGWMDGGERKGINGFLKIGAEETVLHTRHGTPFSFFFFVFSTLALPPSFF